jgi:NADH:ubiquinone reductase (H+-translocating)
VDFLYAGLKYYQRIDCGDLRIVLLHSGDRLLPELSVKLGEFTLRKMRRRGVDVRLGAWPCVSPIVWYSLIPGRSSP